LPDVMRNKRHQHHQPRRDAWLEINLNALEHNARYCRSQVPPSVSLMAIVKADAYGHGASALIPVLEASGFTHLGVASMDEALQLREAGVVLPILVLGAVPDWAVPLAAQHHITLTVFAPHHLEAIRAAYALTGQSIEVHIKVDTGMHRIGVDGLNPECAVDFILACLQTLPACKVMGVFSHLACAGATDPIERQTVTRQLAAWRQVQQALVQQEPDILQRIPHWHVGNTAGTLEHAQDILTTTDAPYTRLPVWGLGYTVTDMPTCARLWG
jgi:alanine racemase